MGPEREEHHVVERAARRMRLVPCGARTHRVHRAEVVGQSALQKDLLDPAVVSRVAVPFGKLAETERLLALAADLRRAVFAAELVEIEDAVVVMKPVVAGIPQHDTIHLAVGINERLNPITAMVEPLLLRASRSTQRDSAEKQPRR